MDEIQPLPIMRRKTYRVRGPRPCSWISSSSSDSSFNEHRDIWRSIQGHGLCRRSTQCSTTSHESSDSSFSSSSSSPVTTPKILIEFGEKPHYRHASRRKPAGPRAPHTNSCFDERPRLEISTPLPAIPQLEREHSRTMPPSVQIVDAHPPSHSSTNFLLDWDAIFDMLGC